MRDAQCAMQPMRCGTGVVEALGKRPAAGFVVDSYPFPRHSYRFSQPLPLKGSILLSPAPAPPPAPHH